MEELTKKVLIITYYWPPSGGSGVQRWLKFVKYLPQYGWQPFVFTPENPSFAIKDESLLQDVPNEAEVIRFPIWEPYDAFFKLSSLFGSKKTSKPTDLVASKPVSLFQRLSTWVRGNLFIPDPRIFWVKPSVKFLKDFIRDNHIKTVITTGPPHSVHLIGHRLKKNDPSLHWIADFRDPWSEWGLLDSLLVGKMARKFHERLERKVLQHSDEVVTITPFYVRRFEKLSQRRVQLLTNGFDESDFTHLTIERTGKFIIRHAGIVNEKCNPRPFMYAVNRLMERMPEFARDVQVDFVGEVHPDFKRFVEGIPALKQITTFTPTVPHSQLVVLYGKSSVLLLILTGYKDAEGYMPGKLFEYLATGLPIIGIGPSNGDASALLNDCGHRGMIDGDEQELIINFVVTLYKAWSNNNLPIQRSKAFETYSRRAITHQLTTFLR